MNFHSTKVCIYWPPYPFLSQALYFHCHSATRKWKIRDFIYIYVYRQLETGTAAIILFFQQNAQELNNLIPTMVIQWNRMYNVHPARIFYTKIVLDKFAYIYVSLYIYVCDTILAHGFSRLCTTLKLGKLYRTRVTYYRYLKILEISWI